MSVTDAVSIAIIAFFLGIAAADRADRRQLRRDRANDTHAIRTDPTGDSEQA